MATQPAHDHTVFTKVPDGNSQQSAITISYSQELQCSLAAPQQADQLIVVCTSYGKTTNASSYTYLVQLHHDSSSRQPKPGVHKDMPMLFGLHASGPTLMNL